VCVGCVVEQWLGVRRTIYIYIYIYIYMIGNMSVDIVTVCVGVEDRSLAPGKSSHYISRSPEAQPFSHPMDTWGFFPGRQTDEA